MQQRVQSAVLPSSGAAAAAADPAALLGNAVGQQMSFSYSPARRNESCQTVFPALCSDTG